MNAARISAVMLSAILASGMITAPALAQGEGAFHAWAQTVEPISISTDKETYAAGETVTVTGEIRKTLQGAISLIVSAPNGNRVTVGQPSLGDDGMFTHTFTAGGPNWLSAGEYMIKVSYGPTGSSQITDTVAIQYGGGVTAPPVEPEPEPVDPLAGITSSITGGTIVSISPGQSDSSIVIIIDATDDGELTLNIPRTILESKTEGQTGDDIPFIVQVDGAETDAVETPSADSRMLVIAFTAGSEVIEVFGSWIIPEFGVIAVAVLAVAIISIVAVSSRFSTSIVPRY